MTPEPYLQFRANGDWTTEQSNQFTERLFTIGKLKPKPSYWKTNLIVFCEVSLLDGLLDEGEIHIRSRLPLSEIRRSLAWLKSHGAFDQPLPWEAQEP